MLHRRCPLRSHAVALLIVASMVGCNGTTTVRKPNKGATKAPQRPLSSEPVATLGVGAALTDVKNAPTPHTLLYVQDSGPWPDGLDKAAPIVAMATQDSQGAVWLLSDRAGSSLAQSRVFTAVPRDSRYPRPGAAKGEVTGGALKLTGGLEAMRGDRVALIKVADGPLTRRIAASAVAGEKGWSIQTGKHEGAAIVARTGSLDPAQSARGLNLIVRPGNCDEAIVEGWGDKLKAALGAASVEGVSVLGKGGSAGEVWLTARPSECDASKARIVVGAPAGQNLLRTPFWNPSEVSVKADDLPLVVALAAGYRGELAAALALAGEERKDPTATLIAAALALEAGWATDVGALLGAQLFQKSVEGRLLLAGAAYNLGDYQSAESHLAWLYDERATPGVITGQDDRVWARVAMSRAAVALSLGKAEAAIGHIDHGLQHTKEDANLVALLLGLAEIQLARGDLSSFVKALSEASKKGPKRLDHQGTLLRYQAMVLRLRGDAEASMTTYAQSAERFEAGRHWHQAATMWAFMAQIAQQSAPAQAEEALAKAERASMLSFSAQSLSDTRLEQVQAFATRSATSEVPLQGGAAVLKASVEACARAERYDQEAIARRYSLLTLPPTADINKKARILSEALVPAMAATDREEIAMLLSLRGRLEAARFAFEAAEITLKEALAFAQATGDPNLVKMIQAELDQIAESE